MFIKESKWISIFVCVYRESQRELEEKNREVLDLDSALKERQGELQQRAQLVPHRLSTFIFIAVPIVCTFSKHYLLSSARAAGCGHQESQAGDGQEGWVPTGKSGEKSERHKRERPESEWFSKTATGGHFVSEDRHWWGVNALYAGAVSDGKTGDAEITAAG